MHLNLKNMSTESRNRNTMNLDIMTPLEIVTAMNREDAKVPEAIKPALPSIAQCVTWAIESVEAGGRIIYMGAGTSGRLGVLDAVECPPTFGVAPEVVVALLAGGDETFAKAVESAEDSPELGRSDLVNIQLQSRDIVMEATGCDRQTAAEKIAVAGGNAKTAITMILADCGLEEAKARLEKARGHVREAIR